MFSVNHDEKDKKYKFCLTEKKVACVPKPALWEIFHCFLIFYLMYSNCMIKVFNV